MKTVWDVIVIGGGPAGASAAAKLATEGAAVLLIEKSRRSVFQGVSVLLPQIKPLFRQFGILPKLDTIEFKQGNGFYFTDQKGKEYRVLFQDSFDQRNSEALLMDRTAFDRLLLNHAAQRGVELLEGWKAVKPVVEKDHIVSLRLQHAASKKEQTVRGNFFIDASGRECVLAEMMGEIRRMEFHDMNAYIAVFEYGNSAPKSDGDLIRIHRFSNGWAWMIPSVEDRFTVGFVSDKNSRNSSLSRKNLENKIIQIPSFKPFLQKARQKVNFQQYSNFSYYCRPLYGTNYLLAGDAAGFMDPAFFHGVYLAVNMGIWAAGTVEELSGAPSMYAEALQRYAHAVTGAQEIFYALTRTFYEGTFFNHLFAEVLKDHAKYRALASLLAGDIYNDSHTELVRLKGWLRRRFQQKGKILTNFFDE